MADKTQLAQGATGAPPLVGRTAERVLLGEQLAAALGGHGSVVILGGEAGIGKTTLARDLIERARDAGALALVGSCHDLMAAPPYGLWLDLADRYRDLPGRDGPPVPDVLATRTLDRIGTQAALFEAVTAFLRSLAATQPVALVLEDVHWADPASLELLRYLAARLDRLPILALVTYRVDELTRQNPFYRQLPSLVRESQGLRLDLRRLDLAELDALVRAHYELPRDDRARLVAYLDAHAEGNPFFAIELLRALEEREDGGLVRVDGGWRVASIDHLRVPPLVQQVIDARIAHLGEAVREPLTIASVIGHDIPLDLLAAIAGIDEDALFAAIDRAIEWHLCTESADGAQIHFVHALTREALYASIPPRRRRALHRLVAETLEARPDPDPDVIAWHYQQALDPRAPGWLTRAGDRAQRAYAWLTARDRFAAAAQMLEAVPGTEITRARLLYRCGRLQRYSNAPDAIANLRDAARLAADAGDRVLAADATYSQGLVQCFADDWARGLATMLGGIETLRSLPPGDTSLSTATAAWIADALPTVETWIPTPATAGTDRVVPLGIHRHKSVVWHLAAGGYLDEANRLATQYRQDGDAPGADPLALSNTGHALLGGGIALASLGDPDSARVALAQARRSYQAIDHHACLAFTLLTELTDVAIPYRGEDVAERQRLASEAGREIERSRGALPADVSGALAQLAVLELEGRWDDVRAIAAGCGNFGTYILRRQVTLTVPQIARRRGDREEAWAHIHRLLAEGPDAEPGSTVLLDALMLQQLAADLCLDADDRERAARWLRANDRWLDWSGAVLGRVGNALGWARWHDLAGDAGAAAANADRAVRLASDPRQPLALIGALRLRGELAMRRTGRAAAEADLSAALDLATACEVPFERAATLATLAELRRDAGAATEALAIATALGARPLRARVERLMQRIGHVSRPAGLTDRELEVLRLVASGLTDVEAGDRLSISPRTIGQHLRSIYSKLDVRSRTEATRYALEHKLV